MGFFITIINHSGTFTSKKHYALNIVLILTCSPCAFPVCRTAALLPMIDNTAKVYLLMPSSRHIEIIQGIRLRSPNQNLFPTECKAILFNLFCRNTSCPQYGFILFFLNLLQSFLHRISQIRLHIRVMHLKFYNNRISFAIIFYRISFAIIGSCFQT